jgi:hypothetical protein
LGAVSEPLLPSHGTHVLAPLHTGVVPVQRLFFAAVHWTHVFARHTGNDGPQGTVAVDP